MADLMAASLAGMLGVMLSNPLWVARISGLVEKICEKS